MCRNSQNAKSSRLTSWQYDVNVSKQTTLLYGVDVGTPKWRVSMGGLIDRVHLRIKSLFVNIHDVMKTVGGVKIP